MADITIKLAKEFTPTPGPRLIVEGPFSGELFRNEILKPKFDEVVKNKDGKLIVDLDGTLGYGTSFLEEAFGGLARIYDSKSVADRTEIVSNEETYLKADVAEYIEKANE